MEGDETCPMCSESIKAARIKKIDDPSLYLQPQGEE